MFICSNCQKEYTKWQGQCDSCGQWGTIQEIENAKLEFRSSKKSSLKSKTKSDSIKPIKLHQLDSTSNARSPQLVTGIHEFDNALGGRLIQGQVILLSGSPGIGKSTLCSQITESFSEQKLNVLYIAGEESPSQIQERIKRLKLKHTNVSYFSQTDITEIERLVASQSQNIDVIFADSIQTLYDPSIASSAGSVSQISESTNRLVNLAKGFGITTFIIGHVTKAGDIAGPKILEHMVDTVLYFEGEKRFEFRILRVEKNRFGPTDEVGIFRMENEGLVEVKDTKELFDPNKEEASGSIYSIILEGTRPIVVEVQALATRSYLPNPRRTTSGFDLSRLFILIAIIEKKLKINLGEQDVYVNITGGIKVADPGLDLAVIKAIVSSTKDQIIPKTDIYFGEVGLTGEVRKVFLEDKRIKESKRLGFKNIVSGRELRNIFGLK
jgi:DNA repair protein RadA/Sms